MPNITSHRCGRGRYAKDAWGSREDCGRCIAADAAFEKAQRHYTEQAKIADETVRAEDLKVDSDGILTGSF